MTRKVHIVKTENDVEEVGIQLRSDSPAPLEKRVHINRITKDMYSHLRGTTQKMNIGVYATDPVDTLEQVWINDTDGKLKWRKGSTVYEMNLPDKDSIAKILNTQDFYQYLLGLDNAQYRDEALVAPKSLYDAFNEFKEGASYTDVRPVDSSLRNDDSNVVGTYELEQRQTQPADHVEGISTFESQAFKPLSITDNFDGTHDVVFSGQISPLLSSGKKFFVYEESEEIINRYSKPKVGLNEGKPYNVKSKKSFPLLDSDLKPAIIDIASFSYDSGNNETTVVFNDGGSDLSLGFSGGDITDKVRFCALPFDSVVGADGLSGSLDALEIQEITSTQEVISKASQGVITKDLINHIRSNTPYETLNYLEWQHSPNKQYWLIFGRFGDQASTDRWYLWYSRDGMASIQFVDEFFINATLEPVDDGDDNVEREFFASGFHETINSESIHINDDGRFIFTVYFRNSVTNYTDRWIYFGNACDCKFIITKPSNSPSGPQNGSIALNTGNHWYSAGSSMDWDSNIFAIDVNDNAENAYVQFWYIDFDQYNPIKSGCIVYSYKGSDYRGNYFANVSFWEDFEGQRMYFSGQRHGNNEWYLTKTSRQEVLEYWKDNDYLFNTPREDSLLISGVSNSLEAGNRGDTRVWMHEFTSLGVDKWHLSPEKTLVCFGADNSSTFLALTLTDLGRTSRGIKSDYSLDFDSTPDIGAHSINEITFDSQPVSGQLTIDLTGDVNSYTGLIIDWDDTAFGIQRNMIDNISWIEEGEVEVTGDFSSGFVFTFKHEPEGMTLSTSSTTLDNGSGAVVETHSVTQTGSTASGGSIDIEVSYFELDNTGTKVNPVTPSSVTIPAGYTKEAIANIFNTLGTIVGTGSNELKSHKYPFFLSRLNNTVIFETPIDQEYNFDGREVTDNNEYFNLNLSVSEIDYDLTLEIVEAETGNVLWTDTNTYTPGNYVISVDYTKFKAGSYLRATSFTEVAAFYSKAKISFEYNVNFWNLGGVEVQGDWASGFSFIGRIYRDLRFAVDTNSLTSGGSPVTPTITQNTQGSGPIYLKYDSDATADEQGDDTLFWNNRRSEGQSYSLRDNSIISQYVMGEINYLSDTFYRRAHSFLVDDYSVILATDIRHYENTQDGTVGTLIKIPDYREFHGQAYTNNSGSRTDLLIQSQDTPRTNGGTRMAQVVTVPNVGYSDGFFPVRTLGLELKKDYSGANPPKNFAHPDAYVRVKLLGTISGAPDDSDVIATSRTKLPLHEVPSRNDSSSDSRKIMPFTFDNIKLSPGQEVAIVVEVEGLDVENLTHDDFIIVISGTSNASGTAYKSISNVWTSISYDMWFYFYDYYLMYPFLEHETEPNKAAHWIARSPYGIMSGGVTESTLGQLKNTPNQFIGTYQVWGYPEEDDNTNYSRFKGGARTFGFRVDNENITDREHPPIIKDEELLGVEDQSSVDKYLVMGHAFGYTPDGISGLFLDSNGKPIHNGATEQERQTTDNYDYDGSTHYGGYQIGHEDNNLRRMVKYTSTLGSGAEANKGIYEDDEFLYGRATQFSGSREYVYHHSGRDMTPYVHDWAWEAEIKTAEQDHDGSDNFIIGSNKLFYIYISGTDASTTRYGIFIYNNWINMKYVTEETVPQGVYHRLRFTRDQVNGLRIFRNFSKTGGTWEELTIDTALSTNNDDGSFIADGYPIGQYNPTRNYFAIGGWTENTSYQYFGRIGYMKWTIGSSSFAYEGLNFDQPEVIGIRNAGEYQIGYQKKNSGQGNVRFLTSTKIALLRHSSIDPAQTSTPQHVASFDHDLTASSQGRLKVVRHTIRREDVLDPSKLTGYILEFYKK